MVYLVTGGSGSGKSAFAEELVMQHNCELRYYIATMKPFGEETKRKINRHKQMRKEKKFTTIECYTGLKKVDILPGSTVLLECMSNLVANEMYEQEGAKENTVSEVLAGVDRMIESAKNVIIVTNEVFSDGVGYGSDMQQYLHNLGVLNRKLAERANQVIEVVYSIPVYHKREGK